MCETNSGFVVTDLSAAWHVSYGRYDNDGTRTHRSDDDRLIPSSPHLPSRANGFVLTIATAVLAVLILAKSCRRIRSTVVDLMIANWKKRVIARAVVTIRKYNSSISNRNSSGIISRIASSCRTGARVESNGSRRGIRSMISIISTASQDHSSNMRRTSKPYKSKVNSRINCINSINHNSSSSSSMNS